MFFLRSLFRKIKFRNKQLPLVKLLLLLIMSYHLGSSDANHVTTGVKPNDKGVLRILK